MYCGWEMRDPLLDKLGRSYENSVAFGLGFGAEKGHPALKRFLIYMIGFPFITKMEL